MELGGWVASHGEIVLSPCVEGLNGMEPWSAAFYSVDFFGVFFLCFGS